MENYINESLGLAAAREGKSITDCPFKKETKECDEWIRGFDFQKPNKNTRLRDVLTPCYGGPIKLKGIYGPIKDGCRQFTGEYEVPFGDWYKPENYKVKDGPGVAKDKVGKVGEYNNIFQQHMINGGVYDVTDLPCLEIEDTDDLFSSCVGEEGLEFIMKYHPDNIYVASGYQVLGAFLFAGKPKLFKNYAGSFGRGACAVFSDCPKSLLIVAEDD
jgi:hypothetical protein